MFSLATFTWLPLLVGAGAVSSLSCGAQRLGSREEWPGVVPARVAPRFTAATPVARRGDVMTVRRRPTAAWADDARR